MDMLTDVLPTAMQNVADVQEIPDSAAGAGFAAGSADADPARPAMPRPGPATTIAAARNDLRIVGFCDFNI
jgi:hypothetical protein